LLASGSDMEVSDAIYEVGDAVEIYAGPLKGLTGHVVKQLGTRNFSVALEQLGASLLLTVPANYLREQ
jgi:transcriptional antiterminator RfaH